MISALAPNGESRHFGGRSGAAVQQVAQAAPQLTLSALGHRTYSRFEMKLKISRTKANDIYRRLPGEVIA
jgi:hypothetical protein